VREQKKGEGVRREKGEREGVEGKRKRKKVRRGRTR
jgi:hypothetical protein